MSNKLDPKRARPDLSKMTSDAIRVFVSRNPYRTLGGYADFEIVSWTQVDVFYGMLCHEQPRPPTQDEFCNQYIKLCSDEIKYKRINIEQIQKRLYKSWATYISELDFICMLRESDKFDLVLKDTVLDAEYGYDMMIRTGGQTAYIHLFIQSGSSWISRKNWRKSTTRNTTMSNPIDFPLNFDDADKVGNMHFYTKNHILRLKNKIVLKRKTLDDWCI